MENEDVKNINKRFDEMMEFLVDNVATKDDIARLDSIMDGVESRMATKDDIARLDAKIDEVRDELMQEIHAVRSDIDSVKRDLARLEKTMMEDSNAFAGEIVEVKDRLVVTELQLKQLQVV